MLKYNWEDKIKFIEDLKLSYGISDFLSQKELVASSGNYDTFKKWMKIHDIKVEDYFKTDKREIKKIQLNTLDELTKEEVLCINSKYPRKDANKLVRKYNLLDYRCEGCGNEGLWNGNPLTLQLEHKNGDSSDHRIENLEYLCPNCHSQTETYGSKNKHNKIFEERIKDIIGIKVLDEEKLVELAQKWKLKRISVYHWLKKYETKINEYGIEFTAPKKPLVVKKAITIEKETLLIKNRLEDLELMKNEKDFEKILLEKWKITINGIRKWIKSYNSEFYQEKYVLTDNYKAKIQKEELENKIQSIINTHIENNHYDLNILLPLFKMNIASCSAYIKNKYSNLHRNYFPVKDCTYCNSNDVRKSGFEIFKGKKQQRYKCCDCKKYFY